MEDMRTTAIQDVKEEVDIDLSKGITLNAAFKVKDNVDKGNYEFKLTKSSISCYNEATYSNDSLWEPSTKSVTVTVGSAPALVAFPVTEGGIGVSKGALSLDETLNVIITVPSIAAKADTASIRAEFDKTAFEVTAWEPDIADKVTNFSDGYFSVSAANSSGVIDLSAGLTLTAKLRVKSDAKPGNYSFALTKSSFSHYDEENYKNVELWTPAAKTASVEITEGSCVHSLVKTPAKASRLPKNEEPVDSEEQSEFFSDEDDYDEGSANPNTGIGVAILLPAATVLPVVLAKKQKRKRGRR